MTEIASSVPALRVESCNSAPVEPGGDHVVYWMIASRRVGWNFALERAADWAKELEKPLLVLEALRCGYRWASDRHHAFILQGMADNARRLGRTRVGYHPYVERRAGAGKGLLEALAKRAAVVVTDDYPGFFLPRMVAAAGERMPVRLEKVDSNGLLPLAAAEKTYKRAVDFRRLLQKTLPRHLDEFPRPSALVGAPLPAFDRLPTTITRRWPAADVEDLASDPNCLAELPIDHDVSPVVYAGGEVAGGKVLERFLDRRLERYAEGRRDVRDRATSELSPYLHFGHVSAHEVFSAVADREGWDPGQLFHKATASRSGWWGSPPSRSSTSF